MKTYLIPLLFVIALAGCASEPEPAVDTPVAEVAPPADIRQAVESAIFSLDQMRSGLAGTLEGSTEPVDAGTFAQVCKPVGMQAAQLSKENGWQVRQVAVKYRNPANQADEEAADISARFMSEADMDSLWIHTSINGAQGWRYLRRITVEPACLACHGEKDSRPEFVKSKYTEDKAFDFEVGDLRGLYSVFVADSVAAL